MIIRWVISDQRRSTQQTGIRDFGCVCSIDLQGEGREVVEATLQGNSTRGSSCAWSLQTVNYRCLQKVYTVVSPKSYNEIDTILRTAQNLLIRHLWTITRRISLERYLKTGSGSKSFCLMDGSNFKVQKFPRTN